MTKKGVGKIRRQRAKAIIYAFGLHNPFYSHINKWSTFGYGSSELWQLLILLSFSFSKTLINGGSSLDMALVTISLPAIWAGRSSEHFSLFFKLSDPVALIYSFINLPISTTSLSHLLFCSFLFSFHFRVKIHNFIPCTFSFDPYTSKTFILLF